MKRIEIILLSLVALVFLASCQREAPRALSPFRMRFDLPETFKADVAYAGNEVKLNGSLSYKLTTGADGSVEVDGIVPGIYDLVTNVEISGARYKEMLTHPPLGLRDDARVVIGVSKTGLRLFGSEDLRFALRDMILRDLLISKVYYSGTKDDQSRNYTVDGYIEIFNNSEQVQYIDGKYLGLAETGSPASYPAKDHPDSIYFRQICRFPGGGTDYPIEPGKSLVVAARSARDHRQSASTSVDLSHATFEVKNSEGEGNPDVPMLPKIHESLAITYLNLLSGGLNAVVLFETDVDVLSWPDVYKPGATSGEHYRRMHKSLAVDGVECLKKSATSTPDVSAKRLPDEVDAGYVVINSVSGYTHESVDRKVSRIVADRIYLVDTNNSLADFVVCGDPTPGKYDKEGLR